MGYYQFSKIEVLHCGKLRKFATRAYFGHLGHGAFSVGTFCEKRGILFSHTPKTDVIIDHFK